MEEHKCVTIGQRHTVTEIWASKIYLESKLFPGRLSWSNFIPGRNCDDCVILIYTHHISACIFILNSVMLQQRPSCVQKWTNQNAC